MNPTTYTDARIWKIFRDLHRRGLAMFIGIDRETGVPLVWLTPESGLDRLPVTIATAEQVLIAAQRTERRNRDVLVGEVIEVYEQPRYISSARFRLPPPIPGGD